MKSADDTAAPHSASPRDALLALLASQAAAQPDRLPTKLPVSGIEATYPPLLQHDTVMAAAKMCGKKNKHAIGKTVVSQTCLFNSARLTVAEIGSLLHNADVQHITGLLFPGDDDEDGDEDGAGN